MNCTQARELYHERIDGELSSAAATELDAHLQNCTDCRVFARHMDMLVTDLGGLRAASMQIDFDPALPESAAMFEPPSQRTMRQPIPPRRKRALRWRLVARIAAVFVLAAGVWLAARGPGARPTPPDGVDGSSAEPAGSIRVARLPVSDHVRIAFVADERSELLAVPVPSSQANVHVFRLLPVVHPDEPRNGF
jgi:anti-sigma factor RsiW